MLTRFWYCKQVLEQKITVNEQILKNCSFFIDKLKIK